MDQEFPPFENITLEERTLGLACWAIAAPGMVVFFGFAMLWMLFVLLAMLPLFLSMVIIVPGMLPLWTVAQSKALVNGTDTQHEIDRLTFAATGYDPRPGRAEREREEALKNAR